LNLLSENKRGIIMLEPLIREEAKKRQGTRTDLNIPQNSAESKKSETRDEVAKIAGVSHDTIRKLQGE